MYVNQIYELVAIGIIFREINLVGNLVAGLTDHLLEILICTILNIFIICSIVCRFLTDSNWTYDVELWGELTHAAFLEILLYRP